jgi:LmbE family N-acetylglucosaminyl deacetylase
MLERVLIVAPHPDDETLAAGCVIQRAGDVRVLFVTDGEANPWPQRVADRKWRIGDTDRERWGALRREEAQRALNTLGAPAGSARFLHLPDATVGQLARASDTRLRDAIVEIVDAFHPTLIIAPSIFDLHADHRAAGYFVHAAAPDANIVTYVIHGDFELERVAFKIDLTIDELAKKRAALECHGTQLRLGRKRFMSHVAPSEIFLKAEHDLVRVESEEEERRRARQHQRHVIRYTARRSR